MDEFKVDYFGHKNIVLHTADMNEGVGDYAFLADPDIRKEYYANLHGLLRKWEYRVIACAVHKRDLVDKYGTRAQDPYHYSLDMLIERFCMELDGTQDGGFICAEKRGGAPDRELMDQWERIRTTGTAYARSSVIDERIVSLELRSKHPKLVGLQLADLVVTPINRHIRGLPVLDNRVQWEVVEEKLCRKGSEYKGVGLVIRP